MTESKRPRMVRTEFRLTRAQKQRVERLAAQMGCTFSAVARLAIQIGLDNYVNADAQASNQMIDPGKTEEQSSRSRS